MQEDGDGTFRLALALSGAISAGAYTAGVLDFLFQALEEWEKARATAATPQRRVCLQVIAGASAGAITGALGAAALAREQRPVPFDEVEKRNWYTPNGDPQAYRCVVPSLYQTWVDGPRMLPANTGRQGFLTSEDIAPENGQPPSVRSLLNAKLLDEIKLRALLPQPGDVFRTMPLTYVANPLHIFLTISNLRGIPFTVDFGNSTYGMQTHGDRMHYAISGLGCAVAARNAWLDADYCEKLDGETLPRNPEATKLPTSWDNFGTSALASSAFPIGLAPRQITAQTLSYTQRSYPLDVPVGVIQPTFPPSWSTKPYTFLNVDGGLINNNPFDYAQFALQGMLSGHTTAGSMADAAVVMVSPFPDPPAFAAEGQPPSEITAVIGALFPTLINQARFRASDLVPAMDPNDYSRFVIAPERTLDGNKESERYTIACGLLGGFGGFLDQAFRAHDFQLGRRNCQRFLSMTFNLPGDNRLMQAGPKQSADATKRPILPLFAEAAKEVPLPHWPRMSQADFDALIAAIKTRWNSVLPVLVKAQTDSWPLQRLGRIGAWFARGKVLDYAKWAILSDLVRRDQIEGWVLGPIENRAQAEGRSGDDVRDVLGDMLSPTYDLRTINGLARSTHLDATFVRNLLAQLQQAAAPLRVVQVGEEDGEALYALALRQPAGFWSQRVVRAVCDWFDKPNNDRLPAQPGVPA